MINVGASIKILKNIYVRKITFGILLHVVVNLASIIGDSVITSDKIIEGTKTVITNFHEKMGSVKYNFYILLVFLSIAITLLIAVSIYCYLVKYLTKQKYLLPYHVQFKEFLSWQYK